MDAPEHDEQQHPWERAVAKRLARLRSMPVDTSRLERALRTQFPRPQPEPAPQVWLRLRPVRAAAASFLVIAALVAALLLSTSSGPVLASPARMARLHEDLVARRVPVVQVDSVAEANEVLARKWPNSPEVPSVPEEHVMACCLQSVKDKKLASVLMTLEGVPVTLTVAHGTDMRMPASPAVVRDAARYHVESAGNLNMVMTERQGRWVCLIGELPVEKLMDVARDLHF